MSDEMRVSDDFQSVSNEVTYNLVIAYSYC